MQSPKDIEKLKDVGALPVREFVAILSALEDIKDVPDYISFYSDRVMKDFQKQCEEHQLSNDDFPDVVDLQCDFLTATKWCHVHAAFCKATNDHCELYARVIQHYSALLRETMDAVNGHAQVAANAAAASRAYSRHVLRNIRDVVNMAADMEGFGLKGLQAIIDERREAKI